jgi:hypothetical protein
VSDVSSHARRADTVTKVMKVEVKHRLNTFVVLQLAQLLVFY